jgi:hypothetical protein
LQRKETCYGENLFFSLFSLPFLCLFFRECHASRLRTLEHKEREQQEHTDRVP